MMKTKLLLVSLFSKILKFAIWQTLYNNLLFYNINELGNYISFFKTKTYWRLTRNRLEKR